MAKFLAVYIGTASEEEKAQPQDPAVEEKGMAAWAKWTQDNGVAIVDPGSPLGRTKAVGPDGVVDSKNELVGYIIVEASSLEEAAAKFKDHPHFSVFPGARVEVMECLDIPGQSGSDDS